MPTYDLSLIVKHALKRPELVASVKRMGESIIDNGGYIRSLQFYGNRELPQRSKANREWHTRGNYFVLRLDLPISSINKVKDFGSRDQTVLRTDFVGLKPLAEPVCTLEEEFKPPAERPSVQAMIDIGRRKPKFRRIYKHNTGLDFYPLNK